MAKFYALDKALICDGPEIRIGEKIYRVDDRKKTVVKMMEMTRKMSSEEQSFELMDKTVEMGLGKTNAKEIADMNLSFAAYTKLVQLITSAMIGEDPEKLDDRFQDGKKAAE